MSKLLDDIGFAILAILGSVAFVAILLWFMVALVSIVQFGDSHGDDRCKAIGYDHADVVVNYPNFWHVTTRCYGGKGKQGVTL